MSYPEYILLCILFYLIGSIPTAYLILKFRHGKNITQEGSGNVGALNSYDVTKSKVTGIVVLVLDFLKGFIPSFIFLYIAGYSLETMLIPIALILVGHNFSVWLKFKGGRGLATAAGLCVVIEPWILLIWCAIFIISYGAYRKVHFGNIIATLLLPVVYYLINPIIIHTYTDINTLITFIIVMSLIILLKHIKPFLEIIKSTKSKQKPLN
ncbi:MAG: glycerol-3-phosphate acyltransferase [Candidatus Kapaibacterium sp.]